MGEKLAVALLPVTACNKDKKQSRFLRMPLMPVQDVLKWFFATACCVARAAGITTSMVLVNIPIPHRDQVASIVPTVTDRTPVQEVEVESFCDKFLWFTVPQAAASAVGLLLPLRHVRGRWSLTFLAIVSVTVAHYMDARTAFVFIAAIPGHIVYAILAGGGAIGFLMVDLLALLSLLIGGPEQQGLVSDYWFSPPISYPAGLGAP